MSDVDKQPCQKHVPDRLVTGHILPHVSQIRDRLALTGARFLKYIDVPAAPSLENSESNTE